MRFPKIICIKNFFVILKVRDLHYILAEPIESCATQIYIFFFKRVRTDAKGNVTFITLFRLYVRQPVSPSTYTTVSPTGRI